MDETHGGQKPRPGVRGGDGRAIASPRLRGSVEPEGSTPCAIERVRLRFDFVDATGRPAAMQFESPDRLIEAWTIDGVRPALAAVEAAVASGSFAAGFVSYEAAAAFDSALTTRLPGELPLVWFGVFTRPAENQSRDATPDRTGGQTGTSADPTAPLWSSDETHDGYRAAVARIHAAIEAGDSYQTNYTFRLHTTLEVTGLDERYERLRAAQRPPYAAYLNTGRWHILSLSPELFFRLDDGHLVTRPMKGTAPRGRDSSEDAARREALRASVKNRAENVMIVDLVRNDIGRVARVGSVRVDSLFDIESYPSLFQMTSTVSGHVAPQTSLTDIFAALFPAGSITGAPKTSSMRLIADIERSPRGVYCGAIGFVAPGGQTAFNVGIRTAVVDGHTGETTFGVGGGITWDSTAGDEFEEAMSKASFLEAAPSFDLLETMRLERGTFLRLDRHLRRLSSSAFYFGFEIDSLRITETLSTYAGNQPSGLQRVRLLVSRDGAVDVQGQPFALTDVEELLPVVELARTPVSSSDPFLCHKTTHRVVYERHRATHPGVFDVLLWNERGEITEFTIGNVVVELEGERLTPPRACGLLDGVFRAALIDEGMIREQLITREDLWHASRLWLINSLREWVEVRLERASQSPRDGITSR
jgi:para-aminobenzoate synthetase/4-amino-4-deoxychorismate lyase